MGDIYTMDNCLLQSTRRTSQSFKTTEIRGPKRYLSNESINSSHKKRKLVIVSSVTQDQSSLLIIPDTATFSDPLESYFDQNDWDVIDNPTSIFDNDNDFLSGRRNETKTSARIPSAAEVSYCCSSHPNLCIFSESSSSLSSSSSLETFDPNVVEDSNNPLQCFEDENDQCLFEKLLQFVNKQDESATYALNDQDELPPDVHITTKIDDYTELISDLSDDDVEEEDDDDDEEFMFQLF